MSEIKYTSEHEWVRVEGDLGTVGISGYAQEQLGDIVFVELPAVGRKLDKGKEFATVESVKAANEVYAPVSGEVVEINEALTGNPGTVNTDPLGEGWFVKLRLANPSEVQGLMDEAAYKTHLEGQH